MRLSNFISTKKINLACWLICCIFLLCCLFDGTNAKSFTDCSATMQALKNIARDNDPAKLSLEEGFNKYVRRTQLNGLTETGIITLKDGSSSKYWFQSHHLTKDAGGTWFVMSDGQEMFMAGWFCCEVQLPDEQLESLPALRQFIRKHHDIAP